MGDVLVCRHLLRWLRRAFPGAHLAFVAPGERGRLFGRFGFADATPDWERADFARLFAQHEGANGADGNAGDSSPSPLLRNLFTPNTLTFAFLDLAPGDARAFTQRIAGFPGRQELFLLPSRPPEGTNMYIGEWMIRSAAACCGLPPDIPDIPDADLPVDTDQDASTLVIHPGSGSARKNWPPSSFAALASLLTAKNTGASLRTAENADASLRMAESADAPLLAAESAVTGLRRIRIVTGEADALPGAALSALLPAAETVCCPTLAELSMILASAALYIGNDSGVTHLASAVRARDGRKPRVAAVFGPSNPAVWAPPGTLPLPAAPALTNLTPAQAFTAIQRTFFSKTR